MAKYSDMKLTLSHKYNKNTSTHGTILTEYILNAGRKPQTAERARKSPCNWVGKKKTEKKKKERKKKVKKESGPDLCPWEGAVKEESFLHPGKPFQQWGDQPGQKGIFRASKDNTSSRFAAAQPGTPIFWFWQGLCAGTRALEIRTREKTGVGCVETDWRGGLESSVTTAGDVRQGSLGHLRGQLPLFGDCTREGRDLDCSFFPCARAHRGRILPAQAPGVVLSLHCSLPRHQEWSLGPCRHPPGPQGWLPPPADSPLDHRNGRGPLLMPFRTPAVVMVPLPTPSQTPRVVVGSHYLPSELQEWL